MCSLLNCWSNLLQPSVMSLHCPPPGPHNKHSNIQFQFLSLCRLQQLATPSRLTVMLVSLLLATPALIFWLWLVILPARVAVLCPEECQCDTGGYYVKCYRPSLTAVPSIRLTDVRVLYITDNNITLSDRGTFFQEYWLSWRNWVQCCVDSVQVIWVHSKGLQSWKNCTYGVTI